MGNLVVVDQHKLFETSVASESARRKVHKVEHVGVSHMHFLRSQGKQGRDVGLEVDVDDTQSRHPWG